MHFFQSHLFKEYVCKAPTRLTFCHLSDFSIFGRMFMSSSSFTLFFLLSLSYRTGNGEYWWNLCGSYLWLNRGHFYGYVGVFMDSPTLRSYRGKPPKGSDLWCWQKGQSSHAHAQTKVMPYRSVQAWGWSSPGQAQGRGTDLSHRKAFNCRSQSLLGSSLTDQCGEGFYERGGPMHCDWGCVMVKENRHKCRWLRETTPRFFHLNVGACIV